MDAVLAIIEAKKQNGGKITKAEVLKIVEEENDRAMLLPSDEDSDVVLEKKKMQ